MTDQEKFVRGVTLILIVIIGASFLATVSYYENKVAWFSITRSECYDENVRLSRENEKLKIRIDELDREIPLESRKIYQETIRDTVLNWVYAYDCKFINCSINNSVLYDCELIDSNVTDTYCFHVLIQYDHGNKFIPYTEGRITYNLITWWEEQR